MDAATFWQVIDASRRQAGGDPEQQIWAVRTGRDLSEYPHPDMPRPTDPSGTSWEEEELADRFPKLAAKFGVGPTN